MKITHKDILNKYKKRKKLLGFFSTASALLIVFVLVSVFTLDSRANPFDFGVQVGDGVPASSVSTEVGCNSVSYDGICNEEIGCNQYNDLDCRRALEISLEEITDLPRISISTNYAGTLASHDLTEWSNQPLDVISNCSGGCESHLIEINATANCPRNFEAYEFAGSNILDVDERIFVCGAGRVDEEGYLGVSAKTEIKIDVLNPVINSFTSQQETAYPVVLPICGTGGMPGRDDYVELNWNVNDEGDAGINRIEIWKANLDTSSSTCGTFSLVDTLESGTSSWRDISLTSTGGFCYGIHVVDNAENWVGESDFEGIQPIKVEIADCNPQTLTLSKSHYDFGLAQAFGFVPGMTGSGFASILNLSCESPECGPEDPVSGDFIYGTDVNLSVIDDDNDDYIFEGWSNGSEDLLTAVTMDSSKSIRANFSLIQHELTFGDFSNGEVSLESMSHPLDFVDLDPSVFGAERTASPSGSYTFRNRTALDFTASPDDEFIFDGWQRVYDGVELADILTPEISIQMVADIELNPIFKRVYPVCVNYSSDIGLAEIYSESDPVTDSFAGLCNPDCDLCEVYPEGSAIEVVALGTASSIFDSWTGGYCTGSDSNRCSFVLNNAETLSADFGRIVTLRINYDDTIVEGYNMDFVDGRDYSEFGDICYVDGERDFNCYRLMVGDRFSINDVVLPSGRRIEDWSANFGDTELETCDDNWADLACENIIADIPADEGIAEINIETEEIYDLSLVIPSFLTTYSFSGYLPMSYLTPNLRTYLPGTTAGVELTLPSNISVEGWQIDYGEGFVDYASCGTESSCNVSMDRNIRLGVELSQMHRVSAVASGFATGRASFRIDSELDTYDDSVTRYFREGETHSVTAESAVDGFGFVRWIINGGEETSEDATYVVANIDSDVNLEAVIDDNARPIIRSFSVNNTCLTPGRGVSFRVAALEYGVGLSSRSVELYMRRDGTSDWRRVGPTSVPHSRSDGVDYFNIAYILSGDMEPGTYYFGVHVTDSMGNCSTEEGFDCDGSSSYPYGVSNNEEFDVELIETTICADTTSEHTYSCETDIYGRLSLVDSYYNIGCSEGSCVETDFIESYDSCGSNYCHDFGGSVGGRCTECMRDSECNDHNPRTRDECVFSSELPTRPYNKCVNTPI